LKTRGLLSKKYCFLTLIFSYIVLTILPTVRHHNDMLMHPRPTCPSKSSASAVRIFSSPSHPLLHSRSIYRSISATTTISVMHGALRRDGRCAASQRGPAIHLKPAHVRGFGTRWCAGQVRRRRDGGEARWTEHLGCVRGMKRVHGILSFLESYNRLPVVPRCSASGSSPFLLLLLSFFGPPVFPPQHLHLNSSPK
jgi:hypothetical protein